jgi:hypothetical protein
MVHAVSKCAGDSRDLWDVDDKMRSSWIERDIRA